MADESVKKPSKLATELAYLKAKPTPEMERESTEAILKMRLGTKKTPRFTLSEAAKGWVALIPALFFLIMFMIYPILNTFIMSFINNFTFVGGSGSSFALANYFAALSNSRAVKPSFGVDNYISVLKDSDAAILGASSLAW